MRYQLTAKQKEALEVWMRLAGYTWTTGYRAGAEPAMCRLLERKGYVESRETGKISGWKTPIMEYRLMAAAALSPQQEGGCDVDE